MNEIVLKLKEEEHKITERIHKTPVLIQPCVYEKINRISNETDMNIEEVVNYLLTESLKNVVYKL